MIKGILASNASKLVASCVCPVAGTVALTVGMPPVRDAVHRATAPRAYALPKTRVRKAADAPMETIAPPVQTAAAPPCEPVLTAGPIDTPFAPLSLGDVQNELPNVRDFDLSPDRINDGPTGDNNLVLPNGFAGIPEPATWLNLIVGFGVIGAAARYSLRGRPDDAEPEQA